MDIYPETIRTEYGQVTADYQIADRIKAAAQEAKRDLEAPPSVMVVEKQAHKTLIVNIIEERLVIYHQIPRQIPSAVDFGLEKIYDEPTDKFRAVLFLHCTDCRIFIMSKLLKLTFIKCTQCQISIRSEIIGLVELFRCVDTNVDIRSAFPLLTAELCSNVHMYQRMEESIYGIIGCLSSTINKVDPETGLRLNRYSVEDLFSSRRFYHLSIGGVRWIEEPYVLNEIAAHLISLPPEPPDDHEEDLPFGKTPPTIGFFTYQLRS